MKTRIRAIAISELSKSYESHACISVSYFGFGRKRNKEKELRAENKALTAEIKTR